MKKEHVVGLFRNLNVWRRSGQRAPHKPLLVLFALKEFQAGHRWLIFPDIDKKLRALLQAYGPPSKIWHTEYPFWRLQNDKIWQIMGGKHLRTRKSNTDALRSELLRHKVRGGFCQRICDALSEHPEWISEIAEGILQAHFPSSLHDGILSDVGLSVSTSCRRSPRDAGFRLGVIGAYEHRCGICGYDGKLGNIDLGLEAAHIRWHVAGGPDIITNGIALCSFHHKAFDLGAIAVSETYRVMVSEQAYGTCNVELFLLQFSGKPMLQPQKKDYMPAQQFLKWHRREVFRTPSR